MMLNKEEFCTNCTNRMIADNGANYALIMLEVYRFRTLREYIGHLATTKFLMHVENTILRIADNNCITAHFDDDKFAIFMPYETINETFQATEELIYEIKNYDLPCAILPAAGICISEGGSERMDTLIDNAKMAMDTVKGKFVKNYAIFNSEIRKQMLESRRIESRVNIALHENEFEAYYMPFCDLQTKEIVGIEALARWMSKRDGMIYPKEFIPLFEKSGFIIDMDFTIYEDAFRTVAEWIKEGYKVPSIKINISPVHIFDRNFTHKLLQLAEKYTIKPQMIIADIICTNNYMQETDVCMIIEELRKTGFQISLDDFGRVSNSIDILANYKLDMVSLDSSITSNINKSKNGNIIVSDIVNIFKKCNILVITEGIETEEQAEVLRNAGCNYGQGYLYYRPMSKDNMKKYLTK